MKKFKLNILQVFILLFTISTLITSCTSEESEVQSQQVELKSLNTTENRQLVSELFTKGTKLNNELEKLNEQSQFQRNTDEEIDVDALMADYQECSDCPTEYKDFLVPFFNEIKDIDDDLVASKIEEYETILEQSNISEFHKDNLRFTLFGFKEASLYALDNPDFANRIASRDDSPGKKIGRGLAGGFLAGCATGAYIGATAGTVTVPVIGTVVGAVSGCIAAGAWGAVTGATTAGIWAALDSIF